MSTLPHFLDGVPGDWPETPCRDRPHLFVDSARITPTADDTLAAQALCAGCPVREACGDYAITNGFRDGIWGGMTVDQRDRLTRARAAAQPNEEPVT